MLSEKRNNFMNGRSKALVEDVLKELEKATVLENNGKQQAADDILSNLKSRLSESLNNDKHFEEINRSGKIERSKLPRAGEYLISSERLRLRTFDDSCRDMYLQVSAEDNVLKDVLKTPELQDKMWEACTEETALFYAIEMADSGEYVGYVAIKNTASAIWEMAIELLPKFRYQGIGQEAICLLQKELYERTGESTLRVRVNSDNYACQSLMKKLGARPNGISEYMLHGEALEQFQKENENLIDNHMREVAEEFCVETKDLLGHVLEYLLDWPLKV